MAVNLSKTAALLTGSQRNMPTQLRLRSQAVEWKTCIRYLGIQIDRSLRIIAHKDKMAVYKCYVRSLLTYVATVWYVLCLELQYQRIQDQQNIALCMIAGTGRFVKNDVIDRDLKVEPLADFIMMLARRTFNRADASPTPHCTTWQHFVSDGLEAISSYEICCPYLSMSTSCKLTCT
ncbi:hypothetical protein EVAR_39319_1 [Eumeta japonica]|uniref:Uncharacterized protein n=1 Tax=Eumeta variegata TaxID=151549 RepID=A0A4C1VWR0_EUMVA|nr:hypothetical protein EVAR_39319_1 [Eumeta japonica]